MDYLIKQATLCKLASLRLAVNYVLRNRLLKVASGWGSCSCTYPTTPRTNIPPAPKLNNPHSILDNSPQAETPVTNSTNVKMFPVASLNTNKPPVTKSITQPPAVTQTNSSPSPVTTPVSPQPAALPTNTQPAATTPPATSTSRSTEEKQLPLPGIENQILNATPAYLYNMYGEEPDQNNPQWNVRNYYYGSASQPVASAEDYMRNPTHIDSSVLIPSMPDIPLLDDPFDDTPNLNTSNPTSGSSSIPPRTPATSSTTTPTNTSNSIPFNRNTARTLNPYMDQFVNGTTDLLGMVGGPATRPLAATANLLWNNRNTVGSLFNRDSWFNANEDDDDIEYHWGD